MLTHNDNGRSTSPQPDQSTLADLKTLAAEHLTGRGRASTAADVPALVLRTIGSGQ